jgi:hypothetical protein
MGNESSTSESKKEFQEKFKTQYTKIRDMKDSYFGAVTIYRQNKNHNKLILV